jgi:hypothetical protein
MHVQLAFRQDLYGEIDWMQMHILDVRDSRGEVEFSEKACEAMKAKGQVLIFMHVPKTAGTTAISIIQKQYQEDEIYSTYPFEDVPKDGLDSRVKCMIGHNQFGLHRNLKRPFKYFTFFRDPVERVLSDYYFTAKFHGLPLESYVYLDDGYKGYCPNEKQTRWATGNDTNDIDLAKNNLNKYFPVIGITEMFVESIFLMKRQFGWDDITFRRENVNPYRAKKREVSDAIIELIKRRNALDIELYHWTKARLYRQIRLLGEEDKRQLEQYMNLMTGQ